MNFTKEQIEFIKELLKQQRVICMNEMLETGYSSSVKEAPEPELPEAVEYVEPYGYIHKVTKQYITKAQYTSNNMECDNVIAIYLHPAIVFPSEKEIDEMHFGYGEAKYAMKNGFLMAINYLKSKIENNGRTSENL